MMSRSNPFPPKYLCTMMMSSRIYPALSNDRNLPLFPGYHHQEDDGEACMFTVWKRSSMSFQGTDGFTVFDALGRLVFRVDNYRRNISVSRRHYVSHHDDIVDAGCADHLVLMDGLGNSLLTLKPQMLSMQCQWNAYLGEDHLDRMITRDTTKKSTCTSATATKLFSMLRKTPTLFSSLFHSSTHNTDTVAEIFMSNDNNSNKTRTRSPADFRIEGSFRARHCHVIDNSTGQVIATLSRKKSANVTTTVLLSDDVFNLVVQPGFDASLVMGFIIILDRISDKPFTPFLCSY